MKEQSIVLAPEELTRVWNLALAMAAADEASEGDLAVVFPQALETYLSFKQHLADGGLAIDDGERTWTSSFQGPNLVLKAAAPVPPPTVVQSKAKKKM